MCDISSSRFVQDTVQKSFIATCSACGDCVQSCKHQASYTIPLYTLWLSWDSMRSHVASGTHEASIDQGLIKAWPRLTSQRVSPANLLLFASESHLWHCTESSGQPQQGYSWFEDRWSISEPRTAFPVQSKQLSLREARWHSGAK